MGSFGGAGPSAMTNLVIDSIFYCCWQQHVAPDSDKLLDLATTGFLHSCNGLLTFGFLLLRAQGFLRVSTTRSASPASKSLSGRPNDSAGSSSTGSLAPWRTGHCFPWARAPFGGSRCTQFFGFSISQDILNWVFQQEPRQLSARSALSRTAWRRDASRPRSIGSLSDWANT
jgi:hypothetical protein